MKLGHWVVLDELNLASQQVLEGLNAVLDHRREVFLPELDLVVRCAPTFRLFAAQNPVVGGGGRKGLPRSFLNRFSRIVVKELTGKDFEVISGQVFEGSVEPPMRKKIIELMHRAKVMLTRG